MFGRNKEIGSIFYNINNGTKDDTQQSSKVLPGLAEPFCMKTLEDKLFDEIIHRKLKKQLQLAQSGKLRHLVTQPLIQDM
jgi:hypothetical protein